jgi:hypothetical protein
MTPTDIHDLALKLFTILVECEAVTEPLLHERCRRTCQAQGLDATTAMLITEALTSYLSGWRQQDTPLETPLAKAQAILWLTMGGADELKSSTAPMGSRLAPYAIGAMIEWVLTAGEETVMVVLRGEEPML